MAVVKNLMIRIGADYSAARKGMQGATRELDRFKRDTSRSISDIKGRNGFGGISSEFKNLGGTVSSSLSRIRGAKGIGGVVAELQTLKPVLATTAAGLRGLGGAAGASGAAFGVAGLAVAGFTALLAVATVGIYHASQGAVKFEADLGRLNMQLKGSTREYMQWARAQGLARSTSAKLGSTYSVLLSSFIKNNQQLSSETQRIVQATRIVSSATGRTIEDTLERMRSGLLGNTEAIEDLGIFVNVSMIESTKAFRRFAGDKSWEQLDFRMQQQIRLAAILEQTYERYGNKLQDNVMTKQSVLMEQLKDIKLNLSQAFLPIWDTILPALTSLAESIAYTTEQLARFSYWLRGWDFDERTMGLNKQTDAVTQQGDAYDDLEKKAAKARKELAAFDRLNLIGRSDGGSGSGSGGAGNGGTPGTDPGGGSSGDTIPLPKIPPLPILHLEFDPPRPPDAGMGGVATAVVATVNSLIAETKLKFQEMWGNLQLQSQTGTASQLATWNGYSGVLTGEIVPGMALNVTANWGSMWNQLQLQTQTGISTQQAAWRTHLNQLVTQGMVAGLQLRANWNTTLTGMQLDLANFRSEVTPQWEGWKSTVSSIQYPLNLVKMSWRSTLQSMHQDLELYRPTLQLGWDLIDISVKSLLPDLGTVESRWATTLQNMYSSAAQQTSKILTKIKNVLDAWSRMKSALGAVKQTLRDIPKTIADAATPNTESELPGRNLPVIGYGLRGLDSAGEFVEESGLGGFLRGVAVPGAGVGGLGNLGRGALTQASKGIDDAMKGLSNLLEGWGISVPAFAGGGVIYGPTLAMVGDNRGAASDPEIIAPASMIQDEIDFTNAESVAVLRQILQAIRDNRLSVVIGDKDITEAAVRGHNEYVRRTGRSPLTI